MVRRHRPSRAVSIVAHAHWHYCALASHDSLVGKEFNSATASQRLWYGQALLYYCIPGSHAVVYALQMPIPRTAASCVLQDEWHPWRYFTRASAALLPESDWK